MSEFKHLSVMPNEIIEALQIQEGLIYVDGTLGGAGHSKLILEKLNGTGHLYSFDQDINVIKKHRDEANIHSNWTLVHKNFAEMKAFFEEKNIKVTGGIVLDLGISSMQLDDPDRGFSFQHDSPLDMRMNPEAELSAYDVVNSFKEKEIADILYKYAEERLSRDIARNIVANRPIEGCLELANIVKKSYARFFKGSFKVNPATKTFQALRIYVNQELENLESTLQNLPKFGAAGLKIAVLSFHSLEDRITKFAFKEKNEKFYYNRINKKPILATDKETAINPRSRSAKLRVAELIINESI